MDGGKNFGKPGMNQHQILAAKQETDLIGEWLGKTRFQTTNHGQRAMDFGVASQMSDNLALAIGARRDLQYLREAARSAVDQIPACNATCVIPKQDSLQ